MTTITIEKPTPVLRRLLCKSGMPIVLDACDSITARLVFHFNGGVECDAHSQRFQTQ